MTRSRRASGGPRPEWMHMTVYLKRDQHRALRIRAAELGRNVAEIVRELVDRFLKETEGRKRSS